MLVIRLQRTGRSGHAQFRVVAQDSRFHPSSGRVMSYLGSYDPHTKSAQMDKEQIESLLSKGAQPSDRVIKILAKEGIKLPSWAEKPAKKTGKVRFPEKRRSTRPAGEPEPAPPTPEPAAEESSPAETPAETPAAQTETPAEAAPAEEPAAKAAEPQPAPEAEAEPAKDTPEPES